MCLCELSVTPCLVYKTKCFDQSLDTIRVAFTNKRSTCYLRWDPSDICTKTQTSFLNQMHKKERSFSPFVLTVDLNAHLYTASSVNKIVAGDYNFYLLLTQHLFITRRIFYIMVKLRYKTSYMPKYQSKFDFSCHDPFKCWKTRCLLLTSCERIRMCISPFRKKDTI